MDAITELEYLDHAIDNRTDRSIRNTGDVQRYIAARKRELMGDELPHDPRMHLGWPALSTVENNAKQQEA
jgi:hypothetical protein